MTSTNPEIDSNIKQRLNCTPKDILEGLDERGITAS